MFLYKQRLELDFNLIGYKSKGESIAFFLKCDGTTVFAGLVDCYSEGARNISRELLNDSGKDHFDFICWTHHHEDHSKGMADILKDHLNQACNFYLPHYKNCSEGICSDAVAVYDVLRDYRRRSDIGAKIVRISSSRQLYSDKIAGNCPKELFDFEISSFMIDDSLLFNKELREVTINPNLYSIGLIIKIHEKHYILAADQLDECFESPEYADLMPLDPFLVKIPHHASPSSANFVDLINFSSRESKFFALSTAHRQNNLPNEYVLKKYFEKLNAKVYVTNHLEPGADANDFGIVTINCLVNPLDDEVFVHLTGNAENRHFV